MDAEVSRGTCAVKGFFLIYLAVVYMLGKYILLYIF